jgi:SWI/SNF-related matrix-associated actin-dependent regulator 1 of chromatin subfamily A
LANDRCILADDMGLCKTSSSIMASLESNAKKILIVCPASLKINWKKEIQNYTNEKILIVEGRKWGSTFKYYIINYDILKNFHITEKDEKNLKEEVNNDLKLLINENFDLAIIDEAHMISHAESQRTKLMNDLLKTIPKVWLLTGTPMTSRPINYYNLLNIVGSSAALNWQHYVKRYCKGFRFKVNGRTIWNTSGHSNLDELRERTKNLVLRRLKTEVGDLPDKVISQIYLELKSTFYNEELEEFMRITKENKNRSSLSMGDPNREENENVAAVLGRLMKVRQVLSYEKIPYTCELIDRSLEQDKKVLVFTNFTMTLDMLHEKYKKNSVVLDGRMSKEKKEESITRFQTEGKIKVFFLNIIAGGVGHNLTAAEVVIMNDLSFVPGHHLQSEDRAFRTGQKKNVMVYYPIFENTIEQIIYNILESKKNVIDQVMGDGEYSESFGKEFIKNLHT